MWVGVRTYINGELDMYRTLMHVEQHVTSFPYFGFASDCFAISFLWLGVITFGWSYALFFWLTGVLWPNNSFKPKPLRGSA